MTLSATNTQIIKELEEQREEIVTMLASYERGLARVLRQTMALQRESVEWWGKMSEKAVYDNEIRNTRLKLAEHDALLAQFEQRQRQQLTERSGMIKHRSTNIMEIALANNAMRAKVGANSTPQIQVVVQSLAPGTGNVIPRERHPGITQLILCVDGTGVVTFDNRHQQLLESGSLVTIPADTWHEVRNTGVANTALKFISFYSPPERE
jgi:quercetin dioxygenase-like cupin family protein